MLYDNENVNLTDCKTCRHARYKPNIGGGKTLITYKKLRCFPIISRIYGLCMSPKIIEHMTWHHSYDAVDEVLMHYFDGDDWKQFNKMHP